MFRAPRGTEKGAVSLGEAWGPSNMVAGERERKAMGMMPGLGLGQSGADGTNLAMVGSGGGQFQEGEEPFLGCELMQTGFPEHILHPRACISNWCRRRKAQFVSSKKLQGDRMWESGA